MAWPGPPGGVRGDGATPGRDTPFPLTRPSPLLGPPSAAAATATAAAATGTACGRGDGVPRPLPLRPSTKAHPNRAGPAPSGPAASRKANATPATPASFLCSGRRDDPVAVAPEDGAIPSALEVLKHLRGTTPTAPSAPVPAPQQARWPRHAVRAEVRLESPAEPARPAPSSRAPSMLAAAPASGSGSGSASRGASSPSPMPPAHPAPAQNPGPVSTAAPSRSVAAAPAAPVVAQYYAGCGQIVPLAAPSGGGPRASSSASPAALPAVCGICTRQFTSAAALARHRPKHRDPLPFGCQMCPGRFADAVQLQAHISWHEAQVNGCAYCHRFFRSDAYLKMHILAKHSGPRPYFCEFCFARFADAASLRRHEELGDRGDPSAGCVAHLPAQPAAAPPAPGPPARGRDAQAPRAGADPDPSPAPLPASRSPSPSSAPASHPTPAPASSSRSAPCATRPRPVAPAAALQPSGSSAPACSNPDSGGAMEGDLDGVRPARSNRLCGACTVAAAQYRACVPSHALPGSSCHRCVDLLAALCRCTKHERHSLVLELKVAELNLVLCACAMSEAEQLAFKRERRRYKNRLYARSSRSRRQHKSESPPPPMDVDPD